LEDADDVVISQQIPARTPHAGHQYLQHQQSCCSTYALADTKNIALRLKQACSWCGSELRKAGDS